MKSLNNIIGKQVINIYIQSYYFKNKLIEELNVIFLKFDKWYKLSMIDGDLSFEHCNEPLLLSIDDIIDDLKYPIKDVTIVDPFNNIILKKIIGISYLKWDNTDEYYGIILYFENGELISFFENSNKEITELTFKKENIPADLIEEMIK